MWFLLLYVAWVGCYRFLDFRGIGLWWGFVVGLLGGLLEFEVGCG